MCICERTAEAAVTLQVPFAAHGGGAALMAFDIKQAPLLAPSGLCSRAGIVLVQPAGRIEAPADIGSHPARRQRAEYIDIAAGIIRLGMVGGWGVRLHGPC